MKIRNGHFGLFAALTGAALMVACNSGSSDEQSSTSFMMTASGGIKSVPKIDICHIPPGNPENAHTISVGAPAVKAHLAHGDSLGTCGGGGGGGGGGGTGGGGGGECCVDGVGSCCL